MFVVDAAVLLPHPPHAVTRVVERLHLLPRWCAGLRRVRFPAPAAAEPAAVRADGGPDVLDRACVFTYAVTDARLTLRARTLPHAPAPPAAVAPAACTHTATGDGLTLAWTFVVEPTDARPLPHAPAAVHTLLTARVEVCVDPTHPLAAARAALCRAVARRVPTDLERLRTLLDRYEASRTPVVLTPRA